ncbi:MAG: hypothetical protein DELT_00034 [Desulfovibrio sp.]
MFTQNMKHALAMFGTASALIAMMTVPAFAASDASIDKAVHEKLGRFNDSVAVEVHDGHVALSGQVGTRQEEQGLVDSISRIDGVVIVNDYLEAISGDEGE